MKSITSGLFLAGLVPLIAASQSSAHDNKYVHPFTTTATARILIDDQPGDTYKEVIRYFNRTPDDANGYNPDTNFNPYLCKIGTQGTIREDEPLFPQNHLPFLNHYWTPWGDHDTWWADILFTRNAIEYAREVFDEAVMHFADGLESDGKDRFP